MTKTLNKIKNHSVLTDFDIDLFKAGKHFKLYEKMGSQPIQIGGEQGVLFTVYAPGASNVWVAGDFNGWDGVDHQLNVRWDGSGIWEGFIPGLNNGMKYKYKIFSHHTDRVLEKGDPFARYWEKPPRTASVIWHKDHEWKDNKWMSSRKNYNSLEAPISVYEVHLASWKRKGNNEYLSWKELAQDLVRYCLKMKFTHVEFMPVMEYPYDPSWGYQVTGYYAPTSRFGEPEGLKQLIDVLHQNEIGVILDWVPAHFPADEHGLAKFDGSYVYEHPDPRKGYHPDWKSLIFNYERPEVRSFLISNAIYWLEEFHVDGLRVDAVASMLYLDYSRESGEWEPNVYGGRENLEAINFMHDMNSAVYEFFPDTLTIAEESTAFPMVTRPVDVGGLGFGQKWMMGWMNDTLEYFKRDPVHRKFHQSELTNSLLYAFTENYVLPLSHDEVVHGKGSLLGRMPGDEWQRFANLRLLYTYMFTHPGSKLLFMGGEFGQSEEWKHDQSLDWHLLEYKVHSGVQKCVSELNETYRSIPALYELAYVPEGFQWIDFSDSTNSVLVYMRFGKNQEYPVIVVLNFTPTTISDYKIGCPIPGRWNVVFNSDMKRFGGSGVIRKKGYSTKESGWHGRAYSLELNIPPLAGIILQLDK